MCGSQRFPVYLAPSDQDRIVTFDQVTQRFRISSEVRNEPMNQNEHKGGCKGSKKWRCPGNGSTCNRSDDDNQNRVKCSGLTKKSFFAKAHIGDKHRIDNHSSQTDLYPGEFMGLCRRKPKQCVYQVPNRLHAARNSESGKKF